MVFVPVALLLLLAVGAAVGFSALTPAPVPEPPPELPEPRAPAPRPIARPAPIRPRPIVHRAPAAPPRLRPAPKPAPPPDSPPEVTPELAARVDRDFARHSHPAAPALGEGGQAFVDAVQKKLVPSFSSCLRDSGETLPDHPLVVVLSVSSEAGQVRIDRATPLGIQRKDEAMLACAHKAFLNAQLAVPNARPVPRAPVFLRIQR